jgi:hypothetical protein
MRSIRPGALVALLGAGLVLAGCGSTSTSTSRSTPTTARASSAASVIRAWSSALRRGDVKAAARYFALPSEFANGTGTGGMAVFSIRTEAQAIEVNADLTCGSILISTQPDGRYTHAVFRLTDRGGPGGDCGSGAGLLASTNFIIRGGRIVAWIRGSDPSGGGGSGGQGQTGTSTAPAVTTTPRDGV